MSRWDRLRPKEAIAYGVFSAVLVVIVALLFVVPACRATQAAGVWPAPLDDVYIHYAFARSAAMLRPFEWSFGNGFSSGNTSPLYPLVLAPGVWAGLRGDALGVWALIVACGCLWDLCRSVRLVMLSVQPGRALTWLVPPAVLSIPVLDWSFFSGMETALAAAVMGRAVLSSMRAVRAAPFERARAQLRAGAIIALLPLLRPETAALGAALAIAVAHGAGSRSAVSSLMRAGAPMGWVLVAQAAIHRGLTGEFAAAGAVRKLLLSNPYATGLETAVEVLKNALLLYAQGLEVALGGRPWSLALFALAAAGIVDARGRRWVVALGVAALGAFALVSLNATARFQNLRYLAPVWVLLVIAALLGAACLWRRRGLARVLSLGLLGVALAAPARRFPREVEHFAKASKNIAEQQVEVGRRLRSEPGSAVVFVGDAGAIPYLSGLRAIDGLGLGGYHDLPFARASVHGVPAVIELVERLPAADRPTLLAVYPSWWPDLVERFGTRRFDVTIDDNVICGAPDKVVYAADWSALEPPGFIARPALVDLDVADLVDERLHALSFPRPHGGWVIGRSARDEGGALRYDAGRIIPEGRPLSFAWPRGAVSGGVELIGRTDEGAALVLVVAASSSGHVRATSEIALPERPLGAWYEHRSRLSVPPSTDRIEIVPRGGPYRSFHLWVVEAGEAPSSSAGEPGTGDAHRDARAPRR